jgi:PAS domain S-box-containing protein
MIENITQEQIAGILETLPVDITFIDEHDTVKFWNKHETRVMKRPASALGRNVRKCHPPGNIAKVNQVISDLKSGRRECVESWTKINGRKINTKNLAIRDNNGKYLGILEVDQDITDIEQIEGEKRLPEY